MISNLEKKIAVVTGANKGIGFECCKQLAENGIKVILTARDVDKGEKSAYNLQSQGYDILFHQLEVTNEKSVQELFSFIKKEFNILDILINNAGVYIDRGNSLSAPLSVIKKTIDVNLIGPWLVTKTLVPLLKMSKSGRIINISSEAGQLSNLTDHTPTYNISKLALNGLTQIFAFDLRNTNIQVNVMCPGWVATDMGTAVAPRTVEEGVDTIIWLATTESSNHSGKFFKDRKEIEW
ncbi:MAG: SDR family oxidoreductase [Candidatus Hodarchaeales archaeon]|jgi:NAD(P)-dependent dehydrogenase (short-subunit alcohol dehydrogenase family)